MVSLIFAKLRILFLKNYFLRLSFLHDENFKIYVTLRTQKHTYVWLRIQKHTYVSQISEVLSSGVDLKNKILSHWAKNDVEI